MHARHVSHHRQQEPGRDEVLARIRLEVGGGQGRERRLCAGWVERVGMVREQGPHGERVQPLVGLGVAAMRLGQEPGTDLGDVLLGERGMHDAIGEHAPGNVEVAGEHGEAEHRPIEVRLDDRDGARTGQRATGFVARKLVGAVPPCAQQQRLDARGALRELTGAAEQIKAHRDDIVHLRRALDHADAGYHVGRGEGIPGSAGRAGTRGG